MITGTVPPGPAGAIGRCGKGRFSWNLTVRSSAADNSSVAVIRALANGTRTAKRRMLATTSFASTTRIPWVMFTAVALSFIPVMTMYGPEAALIAEAFPPRLRPDRLSACLDHRRRAGTVYRDLAVRNLSLDVSDRHLCRCLCDHQHNLDGAAAGLYEQGHFNRGALRRATVTARYSVRVAGAALRGVRWSAARQDRGSERARLRLSAAILLPSHR
jgi:hypothetical protein